MKKITFLTLLSLFTVNITTSQVLYTENFDNLTIGNIGTDVTGQTPGQGGWYTITNNLSANVTPNFFLIENETTRGKVITFKTIVLPNLGITTLMKKNLDVLINKRTQGNNVIEIAFDFFLGKEIKYNHQGHTQIITFGIGSQHKGIVGINFLVATGDLDFRTYDGKSKNSVLASLNNSLIFDNWINFRIYLDYNNRKAYFNSPTLSIYNLEVDFLNLSTLPNLFDDFTLENISFSTSVTDVKQSVHKIDNIKITALNKVPLSISEFLNEEIQVFPNPASNSVHITNNSNILVEEINIYDISGKLVKTENITATENTVLNIENLANGTYVLHIKTNQGTAVKKIVKK